MGYFPFLLILRAKEGWLLEEAESLPIRQRSFALSEQN